MESLFFGQKHSLRNQNLTRSTEKVIASPEYFVRVVIYESARYSTLGVNALSKRDSNVTLDTTRAEFQREVQEAFVDYFGVEHWNRIAKSLTKPPSWTCIRAAGGAATRCDVINELKSLTKNKYAISPVDCMDDCMRLDFLKHAQCPYPTLPVSRVIVDTGCGEAVLRGADVFAPGIKGCTAGLLAETEVTVWIDLDNALMRGDKDVNPAQRRLLYIGVGITVQSRIQIFAENRSGVAVQMLYRPTGESPSLHSISDGRIFLQNIPSALVCHALQPQRGELVLDMCASPGGKTSHLAQFMQDEGVLVACDRTVNKVLPVKECCDKFALQRGKANNAGFLYCCKTDSSKAASSQADKRDYASSSFEVRKQVLVDFLTKQPVQEQGIVMLKAGMLPLGVFDRILLDGPCSSLGLRPRFSHIAMTNKGLAEMAVVQKRMLFNAIMLVKIGGFVSYSTCTFNPGENEHVVQWALDLFRGVVRLVPVLPKLGQPGLTSILSQQDADMVQRFDPSDERVDSIGFFVAKFEKLCESGGVERIWVE